MPAPGAVAAARAAEAALLHAARVGTAEDVRACASRVAGSSLADIDAPGSHGVTPLHAAASRGDPDVARALLDAGAAACHSHARPLRADAESGWTATHRAMYHGKWRVVQALLERGGSLDHPADLAGRTPLDVLAARLRRSREGARADPRQTGSSSGRPESDPESTQRLLYTWGSGVNYQLGHGSRDDVATPRRVDCLAGVGGGVVSFDASKFHSVVALRDGSVRSWGHGRGGRLGVDDAKVHDGDVAALTPTPVPFPVSARFDKHFVVRVAAGKHHTLAVTRRGAVFSWGRGADGRLGYDARDADGDPKPTPSGSTRDVPGRDDAYQRTPRLVAGALRDAFAVDVAAANRHSAVVTRAGEVFAFGSNAFGQLGTRERARAPARATRATRHSANAELCFSQNVSSSERERGAPSFGSPSSHGSPVSSPKPPPVFEAFLRGRSEAAAASASNGTGPERTNGPCEWSPKEADALKPLSRVFVAVSASKQHTLVLDAAGAVYQFGQGDHSPRRVALKHSETKQRVERVAGGKKERSKNASFFSALPEAVATEVAAGANVSLARARDGSVWCWFSRDPHLRSFRVAGFGTANDTEAISVAACESRCAVVTAVGDAYLCDAPEFSFDASDALETQEGCSRNGLRAPALPFRRAEGVRRVDAVRLGETHALATQALSGSSGSANDARDARGDFFGTSSESARELESESDSDSSAGSSGESDDAYDAFFKNDRIDVDDDDADDVSSSSSSSETFSRGVFTRLERLDRYAGDEKNEPRTNRERTDKTKARKAHTSRVPSLRWLAQTSLAQFSCDARSVFELLAFAESVGAEALAAHCRRFATRNADAVFAERGGDALAGVPAETLRVLETWSAELDADARVARDEADAAFLADTEGLVSSANETKTFRRFPSDRRSGADEKKNENSAKTKALEDAALPSRERKLDASEHSSVANDVPCAYPVSWLEARTARGVAKARRRAEPPTPHSRIIAEGPAGSSSRSRRAAADAAASRVARGGLSLFLSGALEDAVARGGGDAAVAAAAAARDARRTAPPRSWGAVVPGIPGDPGAAGSPSPGTAASPSLREIAAAQEREAREAAARARRYAATAARNIETANASGPVYAPVSAPARGVASPAAGATAVSLAALASRSRGAYGGRGEASRKDNPKLFASVWAGGETVLTHEHASASRAAASGLSPARTETPGAFVSLSEILREEEAAAAERASSSETRAGGYAGSLSDGGSLGKSGWFVPDARGGSPGRAAGGLAGIVRDEEATRAAAAAEAAAARRPAPERRNPGGRPKERPKERPKDTRKSSRRGKKETSANDDAARSKGARAPRRGMTDASDPKKRLSRTTPPSTDALDRTTDSRAKAPARKPSRKSSTDIGGDVCEASARGSSRESDVCSFSHAARAVDEKKKKTASSDAPETRAGGRRSRRPRLKPTDGT